MGKIVVFDSGMGSLSIIRPIRKATRAEIIYFADQRHFPYGAKSKSQLRKIISERLFMLNERFNPDLIIVGSNTPTLLLKDLFGRKIIGVTPPIKNAAKSSKSKRIAVLATESVVKSRELSEFVKNQRLAKNVKTFKINASPLVSLVEAGDFIDNPKKCDKIIRNLLQDTVLKNQIDAITLSSTHLPFLEKNLQRIFPTVSFFDPGHSVAELIKRKIKAARQNKLSIYTSSDPARFQKQLAKMRIKNKVNFLS